MRNAGLDEAQAGIKISGRIINNLRYAGNTTLKAETKELESLLINLYADQEPTVRTGHVTTDWFQIRKGVRQGCILSPCLFNFYVEYIMQNAGMDEAKAGIKTAGRNINNLRYADDTMLMQKVKKS